MNVTDNDPPLAVSPQAVTVQEGGDSYTVAPGVTVTAVDDTHRVDETETVQHAAAVGSGDTGFTFAAQTKDDVTVDTELGMTGAQTTLRVTEEDPTAGSRPYTVALATAPVTVASARLTYSASTWQTVTATAVADQNLDNETVTHTLTGAREYVPPELAVRVAVTDNDAPRIVVSRGTGTLALIEGGSARAYGVQLGVAPAGDVVVRVSSDNTTVEVRKTGRNAASSVDLGFSMTTWNTAQMVEVSAGSDDDGADATAMLTHSIVAAGSADEYDLVPNVALTVTVRDTDPRGAAVTPRTLGPLTEDPAGSTAYTVVLATQPVGGTVTIAITSDDETAVSRALEALTFTGTTWKTAQTVTAVMDDDMVDKEVTLTHALTGADYEDAVTVDPVVVTVDDDEEQAIWVDTDLTTALRQTGPLSVAEDGNARYTVELESAPTDPVVVWIGVDDNPDVHAMPGLLRFDANDWNTAQTVTVRADGNADALADEATLTHRAAGGDYTGEAEVAVTEATQPGVILSREGVTVGEGGRNTYTVRLVPPPAGTAEMTVTSGNTEIAPVAPATLTFGPTTWTTPQAVTAPLNAGSTNRDTTLMHTVGGYGSVTAAVNVRVDTGWFIEIDPLALEVQEEGSPVTYTVALINPRTDALTVSVPSRHSMNSNVSALPSMLTFDTSSSTTPQTVTVRAANDGNTISGTARVDHTITTAASPSVVVFLLPVMVTELKDTTPTLAAVPNQTYQVGQGVNARLGGPATGATCR